MSITHVTDYATIAEQAMQDFPGTTLIPLVVDNPDFEETLIPLLDYFWKSIMSKPLVASMVVSKWHIELAYAMGYAYASSEVESGLREVFGDE